MATAVLFSGKHRLLPVIRYLGSDNSTEAINQLHRRNFQMRYIRGLACNRFTARQLMPFKKYKIVGVF